MDDFIYAESIRDMQNFEDGLSQRISYESFNLMVNGVELMRIG